MSYEVKNMKAAWDKVNEVFPTDYQKDEKSSERAGYPVYRSTADGHWYDYICELGDRLEINLMDGQTINIWIKPEEEKPEEKGPEGFCKVAVKALKSGEIREFGFDEFINQIRFFWSSGSEHSSFEPKLQQMRKTLVEMNDHGDALETIYSGLIIKVIYYRWPVYDRYMNRIDK